MYILEDGYCRRHPVHLAPGREGSVPLNYHELLKVGRFYTPFCLSNDVVREGWRGFGVLKRPQTQLKLLHTPFYVVL